MYTCKDNHIRGCFFRLLCKAQAIADIIRHVLDIWLLVVMSKHHSILLFFQSLYFCKQVKGWVQVNVKETLAVNISSGGGDSFCVHGFIFCVILSRVEEWESNIQSAFPIFQNNFFYLFTVL